MRYLTCSVEQTQGVRIVADHDGHSVIVEYLLEKRGKPHIKDDSTRLRCTHSWDVFTREFVGGIRDEEAGLTGGRMSWPSEATL